MGCPCNFTDICNPHCTCAFPYSSFGCLRCCKYGSLDQKIQKAEYLVSRPKQLLMVLQELHDAIDDVNCEFGSLNCFCILCKSNNYDSDGIKHLLSCPITNTRKVLKEMKAEYGFKN